MEGAVMAGGAGAAVRAARKQAVVRAEQGRGGVRGVRGAGLRCCGVGSRGRGQAAALLAAALAAGMAWPAAGQEGALPAAAGEPVRGGMVVASAAAAAPVGAQVLGRGGNAVDAAIATGLAVGCAQPFASGIGGGGFALVWQAAERRAYALDAREVAPEQTREELYLGADGRPDPELIRSGGRAVAVPSLVQGFEALHRRFGRLPWRELVTPAAELCRRGVVVSDYHSRVFERGYVLALLERHPETARIHLGRAGELRQPGALLVQEELARSYEQIAREGAEALRSGALADAIVETVRAAGGVLTQRDLARYQPLWREPVRGSYRGVEVISMPPPSSGGVHVVQMLNTLEPFDLRREGPDSPRALHWIAEAMKLAFADRALLLGDPDFVPVPLAFLVSKPYGRELARRIAPPFWARPPWQWGRPPIQRVRMPSRRPPDDSGTTHISVVDGEGNAVSLTQTINTVFGSGLTAAGTGILLNNEMDDFALAPGIPNLFGLVGSRANAVQAGKRPLSSMSPTLVLRGGELALVTGSPNGPRIISAVLQTVIHVIDFGMNAQQAVAAPRVHHQWQPDRLLIDPGVSEALVQRLQAWGHPVQRIQPGVDNTLGIAAVIRRDPASGALDAGVDPRADAGAALAPGSAAPGSLPTRAPYSGAPNDSTEWLNTRPAR